MTVVTYSELRQDLKKFMDKANEDREPIIISRKNNENAVLIAQDEYDNMRENLYLLSNPANYRRLMESKEQLEQGKYTESELLD